MKITINGTEFDCVTRLDAARKTRRTDIRYNTNGDMLIDLVNRKYELEVVFGLMTEAELEALRKASEEIFATVKFDAPEGTVEGEFHISDEPAPKLTYVNGTAMYGGVKITMKQK